MCLKNKKKFIQSDTSIFRHRGMSLNFAYLFFLSSFLFMQLIKPFDVILYIVLIGPIDFDQKFIDLSYGNSRDRLIIYCFHREYCILLISSFTYILRIIDFTRFLLILFYIVLIGPLSFAQKFIDLSDRNSRSTYYLLCYACSFHHEYYFVYLLCYIAFSFRQEFINLSDRNSRSTYFVYFFSFKFYKIFTYLVFLFMSPVSCSKYVWILQYANWINEACYSWRNLQYAKWICEGCHFWRYSTSN